jgi:hypothetical protein
VPSALAGRKKAAFQKEESNQVYTKMLRRGNQQADEEYSIDENYSFHNKT